MRAGVVWLYLVKELMNTDLAVNLPHHCRLSLIRKEGLGTAEMKRIGKCLKICRLCAVIVAHTPVDAPLVQMIDENNNKKAREETGTGKYAFDMVTSRAYTILPRTDIVLCSVEQCKCLLSSGKQNTQTHNNQNSAHNG